MEDEAEIASELFLNLERHPRAARAWNSELGARTAPDAVARGLREKRQTSAWRARRSGEGGRPPAAVIRFP